MSKLVEFAVSSSMSPDEFEAEIETAYAAIMDKKLDKWPEGMVKKRTTFGGHVLVIESFREFLD